MFRALSEISQFVQQHAMMSALFSSSASEMMKRHAEVERERASMEYLLGQHCMPAVEELIAWLRAGVDDQVNERDLWSVVLGMVSTGHLRATCHGCLEVISREDLIEQNRLTLEKFFEFRYPPLHPQVRQR